MYKLSNADRVKLGNTVVYIAQRIPFLSKTKLLKLLYLMEEYSVVRFKTPFLGLPFEVWQAGPVVKDVFIDLSERPVLLEGYIQKEVSDGKTYIKPATGFCDDEFSDNDLVVMDSVLEKYGHMTARELVLLTHERGSLWYKEAESYGLLEDFENRRMNNSDVVIDFAKGLSGCNRDFYNEQLDFLKMSRAYEA